VPGNGYDNFQQQADGMYQDITPADGAWPELVGASSGSGGALNIVYGTVARALGTAHAGCCSRAAAG